MGARAEVTRAVLLHVNLLLAVGAVLFTYGTINVFDFASEPCACFRCMAVRRL